MRTFLLVAAVWSVFSYRVLAQDCKKLMKIVPEGAIWQHPVLLPDEKGKKPLVVLGLYSKKTMVIIIQREWGSSCAHKGDTIRIGFSDNSGLTFANMFEDDCEGKYAFYVGKKYANL